MSEVPRRFKLVDTFSDRGVEPHDGCHPGDDRRFTQSDDVSAMALHTGSHFLPPGSAIWPCSVTRQGDKYSRFAPATREAGGDHRHLRFAHLSRIDHRSSVRCSSLLQASAQVSTVDEVVACYRG
jgi:hypothetical protein